MASSSRQGTYELEVTDTAADDERDGAKDLGDITGLDGPRFPNASLDGDGDRVDYFRFTLTEAKEVGLGLRQQDADADLFLEDAEGNVLYSSTVDGTANEAINETLLAGTYYVRVEAQEAGDNDFKLRYGVSAPDAAAVTALEQQGQGGTNEAPAFAETSYAFDLAENADGGTTRVALGTVSATDPEAAALTYSIEGGNAAGLFEIDGSTGALSYKGSGEDYESGTTGYELSVRASDGSLHSDVTVTVSVTDVEEQSSVENTAPEPMTSVSEPDGGDLPSDATTTGRVAVDGSATGEIGHADDRDWFAVVLEAGRTYQIDTSGQPTNGGTLRRGNLDGVYDADGDRIPGVFDPSESYIGQVRQDDDQVFFAPDEGGTYYVAASNGGSTDTGTYTVRVTEMEDDYAASVDTTGTVEVGGSATGEVEFSTDSDWFAVELVEGQTYTIDVRGRSTNDGTLRNPKLHDIRDAEGNRIIGTGDFDGGAGYNSRTTFTASESGTYYIAAASSGGIGTYEVEVWEDDFAGSRETAGTIEVGGTTTGEIQHADDRDWFAVELEADKTYQIDVSGSLSGGGTLPRGHLHAVYDADGRNTGVRDPVIIAPTNGIGGENSQAFFTPDEDGTYYLVASNGIWGGTGTYTMGVTEIEDDFSATVDTTGTVEVGGTATGEMQYETDRDWFAVELTAGETYKIELLGGRGKGGTLQDPYIRGIHDSNGRLISDTTDYASGPYSNSELLFTPDEDGTYYVAAGSYMSGLRDEDVGTYTLQVSIDDFGDDTDTTGTVDVGGSVTGEIEAQGDNDWFAVTLEAGKTYQIDMEGSPTDGGTLANPFLHTMRDADGDKLRIVYDDGSWSYNWGTSDLDSGEGLNSRVTFTPDEDGTYYVVAASGGVVGSADSHGRSLGTYTLSVEELVDAI